MTARDVLAKALFEASNKGDKQGEWHWTNDRVFKDRFYVEADTVMFNMLSAHMKGAK